MNATKYSKEYICELNKFTNDFLHLLTFKTPTCGEIFGCSVRSLMRWVDKYNNTQEIKRKTRKYIAYKVKNH